MLSLTEKQYLALENFFKSALRSFAKQVFNDVRDNRKIHDIGRLLVFKNVSYKFANALKLAAMMPLTDMLNYLKMELFNDDESTIYRQNELLVALMKSPCAVFSPNLKASHDKFLDKIAIEPSNGREFFTDVDEYFNEQRQVFLRLEVNFEQPEPQTRCNHCCMS